MWSDWEFRWGKKTVPAGINGGREIKVVIVHERKGDKNAITGLVMSVCEVVKQQYV